MPLSRANNRWLALFLQKLRTHVIPQHDIFLISDRQESIKSAYRRSVREQQTTHHMCFVFVTLAKITKNNSKVRTKENTSWVWEKKFFKILIHSILLFKIKLTIKFVFFSNYRICHDPARTFLSPSTVTQDNPHDTAWLDQISREQCILAWDDGKRWGHMTTNLAESLNSVLKK